MLTPKTFPYKALTAYSASPPRRSANVWGAGAAPRTGDALDRSALEEAVWEGPSREPYLLETSLPGVFAAGDVRGGSVKRVASAVGEGSVAVRSDHQHLADPGE
jgi:thioredoxin reductase